MESNNTEPVEKGIDFIMYVPVSVSFVESDFVDDDEMNFDQLLEALKDPEKADEIKSDYFWENIDSTESINDYLIDGEVRINVFDNIKGGKYHKVESVGIVFTLEEVKDLMDICEKAKLQSGEEYIGDLQEKLKSSIADYQ